MTPPGILPCQTIEALIATARSRGHALRRRPGAAGELDLRLGARRGGCAPSFLAGPAAASASASPTSPCTAGPHPRRRARARLPLHRRAAGALALPDGVSARANPKSSTGRIDVFVRLLTDRSSLFDDVEAGYRGPLTWRRAPDFLCPGATGVRLNSCGVRRGPPPVGDPLGRRGPDREIGGTARAARRRHRPRQGGRP